MDDKRSQQKSLHDDDDIAFPSSAAFDTENEEHLSHSEEDDKISTRKSIMKAPRMRSRSLGNAWQGIVTRIPIPQKLVDRKEETCSTKSDSKSHLSVMKESFQSGVKFAAHPFQIVSASVKRSGSMFAQRSCRPRWKSQDMPPQRPKLTRYTSVMHISAHELNMTLSPVYRQSYWDFVALFLSYCSEWLTIFVPSVILLYSWYYFIDRIPVTFLQRWWTWWVNLLHTERRQAHEGTPVHTGKVLAVGAALAIYNSAMQPPPPPRRIKRRKR